MKDQRTYEERLGAERLRDLWSGKITGIEYCRFPLYVVNDIFENERPFDPPESLIEQFGYWTFPSGEEPQVFHVPALVQVPENFRYLQWIPGYIRKKLEEKLDREIPPENEQMRKKEIAERILKYSRLPAETAPPVIIFPSGQVFFGVHRFIAAILRGDKTLRAFQTQFNQARKTEILNWYRNQKL